MLNFVVKSAANLRLFIDYASPFQIIFKKYQRGWIFCCVRVIMLVNIWQVFGKGLPLQQKLTNKNLANE